MFELSFIIPTHDNSGIDFGAEHFDAFERVVIDLFGGVTRVQGSLTGAWMEGGRVYRDRSVVYVVAVSSIVEGGKVAELVEQAKAHFEQEAIYVRYLGLSEIL